MTRYVHSTIPTYRMITDTRETAMRCRFCCRQIYFTGVLYRSVEFDTYHCYANPRTGMHEH